MPRGEARRHLIHRVGVAGLLDLDRKDAARYRRCMSAGATAEERANAGGRDYEFWRAHRGPGLVWSNLNASDDIMIWHALLRPNFHLLLEIAAHFGLARLQQL